jgi:membrane protease YdiL (CAAX protease family)
MQSTQKPLSLQLQSVLIALEIAFITLTPVVLLQFQIIPNISRVLLFACFFILILPIIALNRYQFKHLGIRVDNFVQAFKQTIPLIIVSLGVLVVVTLTRQLNLVSASVNSIMSPLPYLLISIPAQQLVYFGYLYPRLKTINTNPMFICITIGILFGSMHIPWGNPILTLTTTLIGISWAYLYTRHCNLFASILTHILIGGAFLLAVA